MNVYEIAYFVDYTNREQLKPYSYVTNVTSPYAITFQTIESRHIPGKFHLITRCY